MKVKRTLYLFFLYKYKLTWYFHFPQQECKAPSFTFTLHRAWWGKYSKCDQIIRPNKPAPRWRPNRFR